ncbi:PRC-barrel domain-containing protein [Streptomyces sp. NPDC050636]|uniref:PRC-barrel domain-containing protein n=1 Tax=Streptomyces sp. NPDC050636 TaxID=3154510 RepID=UPI00343EA911
MTGNIWSHRDTAGYRPGTDLTGFMVEAIDGTVGKVDKHSDEVDAAYLVVETGGWIFGKHVLLPAGVISSIDLDNTTLYVARTKDEIKNAPKFDKEKHIGDSEYHRKLTGYYGAPHS